MSENTWFTKPSLDVKSICENMTVEEHLNYQKLTDRFSWRQGIFIGIFAVVYSVIGMVFQYPIFALWSMILVLIPVLNVNIHMLYNEQKKYLCSTEWAKSQGYTPKTIELHLFH